MAALAGGSAIGPRGITGYALRSGCNAGAGIARFGREEAR